jgi:NTP pyrophosphatase (non-canonical NTP hydrolase)
MKFPKVINDQLNEIGFERLRQGAKWGLQRHDYGTWLQILVEEVGEVAQAMQTKRGWGKLSDADDLYKELIHVAAVAAAIAEQVLEEKEEIDYKSMALGDLIKRILNGDQVAGEEFEARWGIPFEQLGTACINRKV